MKISAEVAVAVTCLIACVCDVRNRRIPNILTLGMAGLALAFHAATGGLSGTTLAAGGWFVGALLFFPLFALGGMGAGDVKLLAAIGAWLGPISAVWTGLYGAIAGGVMAILVALFSGYLRTAFKNLAHLLSSWWLAGVKPVPAITLADSSGPRLAYALPITAGAMVTLWLR